MLFLVLVLVRYCTQRPGGLSRYSGQGHFVAATIAFWSELNTQCCYSNTFGCYFNTLWCYVQTLGCNFNTWGCGPLLTLTGVISTPSFYSLGKHRTTPTKNFSGAFGRDHSFLLWLVLWLRLTITWKLVLHRATCLRGDHKTHLARDTGQFHILNEEYCHFTWSAIP